MRAQRGLPESRQVAQNDGIDIKVEQQAPARIERRQQQALVMRLLRPRRRSISRGRAGRVIADAQAVGRREQLGELLAGGGREPGVDEVNVQHRPGGGARHQGGEMTGRQGGISLVGDEGRLNAPREIHP